MSVASRILRFIPLFLLSGAAFAQGQVCDVDVDGDVDIIDVQLIYAARNQPASGPDDPRDPDRNGTINVLDARQCVLMCTLPGCAQPPTNNAPVADAGADQTADVGDTVTLNGSGSIDIDGDPLTFAWQFIILPSGSSAVLSDASAVMPTFVADTAGDYLIELVVNDGTVDSPPDDVVIVTVPGNTPPTADAGPDQTVTLGDTVTLDGSGSTDVDLDPLTYFWTLANVPTGSGAVLSDPTAVMPTFVADLPGTYIAELVVDDGFAGSLPDIVQITTANTQPVADAGPDQSVALNDLVQLDGSGSFDADSDPLTYSWSLTSVPVGSSAALGNPTTANPTFVVDVAGTYVAQLIVNDGATNSDPDTVVIDTVNTQPVADAGADQTVTEGDTVQLDGSGSNDADGDPLTFAWSFTSRPAGSTSTLSDPTIIGPSFDADVAGLFVVQLIVNDGQVDSDPDTTTVTVEVQPNEAPTITSVPPVNATVDVLYTYDVEADDPDGDTLTFSLDTAPAGMTIDSASGLIQWTPVSAQAGDNQVAVRADDGNGGLATQSFTIDVAVGNSPPNIISTPILTATEDVLYTYDVDADDPDGDTLTFSLDLAPAGMSIDSASGLISWTPATAQIGSNPVTVRADDGNGGFATQSFTIDVAVGNSPPNIISTPILTATEDVLYTYDVDADDPDGDTLTFSLDLAPAGMSIDSASGLISWTPATAQIGSNPVTVRADDGNGGFATQSFTIDVAVGNSPPNIISTPILTATEDVLYTYDVDADDPDGDTLTFTLDLAPAGMSIDSASGLISWTPATAQIGSNPVTVRADDGNGGFATQSFTIDVADGNRPPSITSTPNLVATEDILYTYDVNADDPDGDTLTYSLDVAPAGMTIDPASGLIQWTPASAQIGDNSVTARVEDPDGEFATQSFTINVSTLPAVTIVATDPDAAENPLDPGEFTLTRTGDTTNALSVNLVFAGSTTNGVDYQTIVSPFTIPAGQASVVVPVIPIDDNEIEGAQDVDVSIVAGAGYVPGSPSVATVSIADDDVPEITIVASDANAAEAGLDTGTFTLTRTGPTTEQLIVVVSLGGTAVELGDYDAIQPGNVFQVGESSIDLTVTPRADNLVEGDETVIVSINSNASYTVGTPGSATVTIADDPAIVTATAIDGDANEAGPDSGTIRFTRTGGNQAVALTVQISTSGAASNGQDYGPVGASVSIPANQATFDLVITPDADNLVEGTEDVIVTIDTSSNYNIGTPGSATVNITDDPVIATIVATDPDASEIGPDPGEFTITRSGGDTTSALAILTTISGTATEIQDYGNIQPNVLVPANQTTATVTINPITDANVEGDETVILTINDTSTNNYIAGTPNSATVTITENTAPVADAGPDQTVFVVDTVQLDASASTDADGDTLTFAWSTISAPAGGVVAYSDAGIASPTATFSVAGTYVLQVDVSDGTNNDTDTVAITVDPAPSVSINDASISEGDSGTSTMTFNVTISTSINRVVTVNFATADSSATTADADYVANAGIVTFPANSTAAQSIDVTVNGDTNVENDEILLVNLSAPTNATIADSQGVGTILNDDAAQTIVITPSVLNLDTVDSGNLTVTISQPAPAGGQAINLASNNGIATVPASVIVPASATTAQFAVTSGSNNGTSIITATAAGFTNGTATVNVANRTLTLALADALVGEGRSVAGTVTLSVAAPVGGITVTLASVNPVTATVTPTSVAIPAGQFSATFQVNGINAGSTTITGNAPGYDQGVVAVEVTNNLITMPINLNVPLGQTASLPITIAPDPAPAGGVLVTLTSDNPANVAVTTPTVTIPQGAFSVNATVTGSGVGPATISGSSVNFASDTTLATTTAEFDILETSVVFNEAFSNETLTIQLESQGNPVAAPAPVDVVLTAADPGCVAVTSPVTIGTGFVNVVTPVLQYGGSTPLPCSTVVTASDTTITPDTVNVTVNPAPGITMFSLPATVGAGLQTSFLTARLGDSQHGGVTMRIESSDPTKFLIAPNASTIGTPFIDVNLNNGQTDALYVLQGVEGATGDATITATATGFNDGTGTATIVQPAFRLEGLVASIDSLDPDDPFYVRVGLPNAANTQLIAFQVARFGGGGLTATISNSDPAVGELFTNATTGQSVTVQIQAGQSTSPTTVAANGVAFSPNGTGVTTVSASIPGFIALTGASQTVNVTAPGIQLFSLPTTIGAGLQSGIFTARLAASQHGGVTVRIESSDPSAILVSPNASTAGTAFIDVTLNNGFIDAQYYLHAVEGATSTATITASAPGFTSQTDQATAVQPGIRIEGLLTSIDTLDPDDVFNIRIGIPNALGTDIQVFQSARAGGGGVTATVVNSAAGVGELVTNSATGQSVAVLIAEGSSVTQSSVAAGGIAFRSLATGTTNVTATAPGFLTTDAASRDVLVTAPGITLFSLPWTVGAGLQDNFFTAQLAASQHGGVTMRIQSSDPSLVLVAPNSTTPGTPFIDVPVPNGQISVSYSIQGVEGNTGTATLTATAPGFSGTTGDVIVVQPALRIEQLASSIDTLDADDPFFVRVGTPNAGNTSLQRIQPPRTGGGGLTATIVNSVATVGELVTTAATGQSVTVNIAEGVGNSPISVALGGAAYSPLGTGSTTVSASIPGFIATDAASIDVTVSAPGITLFSLPWTVGSGLQDSFFTAQLGATQHGGVTMRIESSNPSVVLVAPNASTPGTAFIDIPVPNGQQNASYSIQGLEGATGTVSLTASAPGFIDASGSVSVVQPGVQITGLLSTVDSLNPNNEPFAAQVGIPNSTNTALQSFQEVRTGGGGLTVTFTNSNAAVAELLNSTTTGQSVTATIAEGAGSTPNSVAAGGVALDGLGAGTTLVSASIPNFVSTNNASQSVTIQGFSIPTGQQNLTQLAGTTATASTEFSTSFAAPLAIDELNSTSWCSANNDPAPAITVDFSGDVTVNSIQMINFQFNPTFSFITGVYRILDSGGGEIFNSGTVGMTNGGINLPVSPAVSNARTVVFEGVSWNSIEPCLSEMGIIGTSP